MSLIRNCLALLLVLLIGACAQPPGPNPYQQDAALPQPGQGAVSQLQQQARAALDRGSVADAIELLQRAIRIEPRNPFSWHYLAQSYRRGGDLARCNEMAQRSFSYSSPDDGLDEANRRLRAACQQGY